MSPEKKKQRRCDLLTTIALFLGLVFTCRLWPLLLLMMLGVFTYAIWAMMDAAPACYTLAPSPIGSTGADIGTGTDQQCLWPAAAQDHRRTDP